MEHCIVEAQTNPKLKSKNYLPKSRLGAFARSYKTVLTYTAMKVDDGQKCHLIVSLIFGLRCNSIGQFACFWAKVRSIISQVSGLNFNSFKHFHIFGLTFNLVEQFTCFPVTFNSIEQFTRFQGGAMPLPAV